MRLRVLRRKCFLFLLLMFAVGLQAMATESREGNLIAFADANVKAICVANWDTNGDGELSMDEAAAVTDIGTVFSNKRNIVTFDELQFFVGLTSFTYDEGQANLIGDETGAFMGCANLTSIMIPNTVTDIGLKAFEGCNSLVSITIPSSVTSIGEEAFISCPGLEQIIVEEGNTVYDSRENCNAIIETNSNTLTYGCKNTIIPNTVTSLGDQSFYGCSTLSSITIPNSVTTIGFEAFGDCTGLTSIVIPNSVSTIELYAFYRCSSLITITLSRSVTNIEMYAFSGCLNLSSITVQALTPPGLGSGVFQNVNKTIPIYIPAGTVDAYSSIGGWNEFSNFIEMGIVFADANVESICLDNFDTDENGEISQIEAAAVSDLGSLFSGNQLIASFDELHYFTGLSAIGDNAFAGCTSLTSVTFPNAITSIGTEAFAGCTNLTFINIPGLVTSIGEGAFSFCTGLTSLTVNATTPPVLSSLAFQDVNKSIPVYVPGGATSAYLAADGWDEFFNYIGAIFFADANVKAICVANWDTNGDGELSMDEAAAVTYLGSFYSNNSITSFDELQYFTGLTSISSSTFSFCSNLSSVVLPNNLNSIGDWAFWQTGVTTITIPNSVTGIGEGAFGNLEQITLEEGNPVFDARDNCNAIIRTATNTLVLGCNNSIIPNSVTAIDRRAFVGCSGLTSITIPSLVTNIGEGAFSSCGGLVSLTVRATTPPTLGSYAFSDVNKSIPVYIPGGTIDAYSSAEGWNEFTNFIEFTITFADANVKALCVNSFDTDEDGEISIDEAAVVTNLGNTFSGNQLITSFDELHYFTGLSAIGDNAFAGCTSLTSVAFPDAITSIGTNAFAGCTSLTSIKIPGSVTSIGESAFSFCTGLTSLTVNATTPPILGNLTFQEVDKSIPVYVPNGTTSVYLAADGWNEFFNYNETSISFADANVKAICVANWDTDGDGEISYDEAAAVTDLGNVFQGNEDIASFDELQYFTGLTSLGVEGSGTFNGCTNLSSVVIPNSVTVIGEYAFDDCTSLTAITIPSSVTEIGDFAFNMCTSLTSIVIPNSVTTIGANPYAGCTGLETISVETGNQVYDSRDNCNAIIETSTNIIVAGCANTTIPNTVTSIGLGAFASSNLTTIDIPNSVTSISDFAFTGCEGLSSITVMATTPPTLGSNVFDGVDKSIPIYIPGGTIDAYSSVEGWNEFTNYIEYTIVFADANVESICFDNFDTDENGEISLIEAAAVTDLGSLFSGNQLITSFDELQYFTGLSAIGVNAFAGCTSLTSVTFPNAITSIGTNAFSGCTSLTSIKIPGSVTSIGEGAFSFCTGLTSMTVNATTPPVLGNLAFQEVDKSIPVYVPGGTASAYLAADGWNEFFNYNETSIFFTDANVKSICIANWDTDGDGEISFAEAAAVTDLGNVFQGNEDIASFDELQYFTGLTSIGENAFSVCRNLASISIPNSVTLIGDLAFLYCSSLTTAFIPNSVTSLGYAPFGACDGLEQIIVEEGNPVYDSRNNCNAIIKTATNTLIEGCKNTIIPNTVTSIGSTAFAEIVNLTSISIPYSVTNIGDYAFAWCESLASIVIPNSVNSIGEGAFSWCESLVSINIPNSVTTIEVETFSGCTSLESITIPNSVTTIGVDAFNSCVSLISVSLPNALTTIGDGAFASCESLTSLNIPGSVTSIGNNAFGICTNLSSITVLSLTPPVLGSDVFQDVDTSIPVYIPGGTIDAYSSADGWSEFTNFIESNAIVFADENVEAICVEYWDSDEDGYLSYAEADAVTDLGDAFQYNEDITSFDELQYFTGLTSVVIINNGGFEEGCFMGCSNLTSIVIPSSVTAIGDYAFSDCVSLTSISIPSSVTTIGESAFEFAGLTAVNIPNSVTSIGMNAFNYCESLVSVTLPDALTTIEENVFGGCSSLTSINIPRSVTSIGDGAFSWCIDLASMTVNATTPPVLGASVFDEVNKSIPVYVPGGTANAYRAAEGWDEFFNYIETSIFFADANVEAICLDNWDFDGDGQLSFEEAAAVTHLGGAFQGNEDITSFDELQYFTGLDYIGRFQGCHGLASITLPNSAEGIDNYAFEECASLTSITIPSSVTEIGEGAFARSGLTTITIPNSVTSIGFNPFTGCNSLVGITVEEGNTVYDSRDNCNAIIETATNTLISGCQNTIIPNTVTSIGVEAFAWSGLTSIIIPNSVTSIGDWAFAESGLTTITIPSSVTSIGEGAFEFCTSLVSIEIPNSVTSIGDYAFEECENLTSITIPNSVTSIGDYAFAWSGLTTITVLAATPPTIGGQAFQDVDKSIPVYIPNGTIDAYTSADGWSEFTNFIGLASGDITAIAEPAEAGTVIGAGHYDYQVCTLTATAHEGYVFLRWTENGDVVSTEAVYTFPVVVDRSLVAHFALMGNIVFADATVKSICVDPQVGWDTNVDGELSYVEAAMVTDLGGVFQNNTEITSFNELQYFTGLTSLVFEGDIWGTFYGCTDLTTVVIPNTVSFIGDYAFEECTSLESIIIPNSVTGIGNGAFEGCSGLTSVTIPNSVTSIGDYAFAGAGLTSITIPNSVTSIGFNPFTGCNSLVGITVEEGNTVYDSRDNCNAIIETATNTLISGCQNTIIPNTVTSIGFGAFAWSGLTSIIIPNSVTSIGDGAFGMTGLTSMTVMAETPPTLGNDSFESVDKSIPVYVPYASLSAYQAADGWNEFTNFIGLASGDVTAIAEPAEAGTVTGAGHYEYQTCTLTATANEGYVFVRWIENGEEVSTDAVYTFPVVGDRSLVAHFVLMGNIAYDDENVKALCVSNWDTDGDGEISYAEAEMVTDLGGVFQGNTEITSFDELQYFMGLTSIGEEAFGGCTSLVSIEIPNSVTSIGDGAFAESGLTTITIPSSVTSIGIGAFSYCANLNEISVDSGNPIYDSRDNCNAIIETATNTLINGCSTTIIPNSVTSIGMDAFGGCTSLVSIEIPNSVTSIGNYAFEECENLTSITLTNSVTSIGDYAFAGSGLTSMIIPNSVASIGEGTFQECENLTSITIPKSVTSIGEFAFAYCESMDSIVVHAVIPPTIVSNTFESVSKDIPVYVPFGTVSTYQEAEGWSEFTNFIESEPVVYSISVSVNTEEGGGVIGYSNDNGVSFFVGSMEMDNSSMPDFTYGTSGDAEVLEGSEITLVAHHNVGWFFVGWSENDEILSYESIFMFAISDNHNIEAVFEQCDSSSDPELLSGRFSVSECSTIGFARSNTIMSLSDLNMVGVALYGIGIPGLHYEIGENQWDRMTYDASALNGNSEAYEELLLTGVDILPSFMLKDNVDCWHIPTWREWDYMLNQRETASGIRFAYGIVNDVSGLIILPDDWESSTYNALSNVNEIGNYDNNVIDVETWTTVLEPAGAVFLPANGYLAQGQLIQESSDGQAVGAYPGLLFSPNGDMGQIEGFPMTGPMTLMFDMVTMIGYAVTNNTSYGGTSLRLAKVMDNSTATVALASNDAERGTVSGAGEFACQQECSVTATANDGYVFLYWLEDGVAISLDPVYSFKLLGDRNLTAVFAPVDEVSQMIIETTAPSSSSFQLEWFGMGLSVSFDDGTPPYHIPFGTTPESLDYLDIMQLIQSMQSGNANTNYTHTINVIRGSNASLDIMIPEDLINFMMASGGSVSELGLTFNVSCSDGETIVEGATELPFTFLCNCEAITLFVDPEEGGEIIKEGELNIGESVTLTAVANEQYYFVNWTLNGVVVSSDPTYSFVVTAGGEMVAHFEEVDYEITAIADPVVGGVITGGGRVLFELNSRTGNGWYGASVTVSFSDGSPSQTFTLDSGYYTSYALEIENGVHVTMTWNSGQYDSQCLLRVQYENCFDFENGYMGYHQGPVIFYSYPAYEHLPFEFVCFSGPGSYSYDELCVLTAVPNEGYSFESWTENDETVSTEADYGFNVWRNRDLVANFSLNNYEITATANPEIGGSVTGAGNYDYGTQCTLIATPNEGYGFVAWTENDETISTDADYSFTVTGERSLVAVFMPTFVINAETNNTEYGYVTGDGTYSHGSQCTLTAIPNEGYAFSNWMENGEIVSTDAIYSFTVTGARNLVAMFLPTYVITVETSNAAYGTVTGGGTYVEGETCTVTATPAEGYVFSAWTEDSEIVSTDATYGFTVESARNLVAVFLPTYVITAEANNAAYGTVTGGGTYVEGETCTVTATPAEGYAFVNWTENGEAASTEAEYGFTVMDDRSLVANFVLKNYDILATANPSEGGMVSGAGNFNHFETCTLVATANWGFTFISWTLDGNVVSTEPSYTFTVTGGGTYVANFQLNSYTIGATANPSEGGTVSGAGDYNHFETCTLTATASEGYDFDNWTLDGAVVSTEPTYTFTVTRPAEYVANFSLKSYEITATVTPSGAGTVTGTGTYSHGSQCTLTAVPAEGNAFSNWMENGEIVSTDAIYAFTVTGERNLVAAFLPTYVITVETSNAAYGTVTGGGTYVEGETCTVTATPAEGYVFSAWTEDGETVSTDAIYGFTVTGDRNLEAVFLPTYEITAEANNADYGTVTGGGTYVVNETCTVTATPAEGYAFVNWTENGEVVFTEAEYAFTVTGDRSLVANFVLKNYDILATANPGEGGTVSGAGNYIHFETCTLVATANWGYTFINWTLDGNVVSTEPSYTFTVTSAGDYTANFQLNNYAINASANPSEGGSVSGTGNYDHGTECTLTATANVGYTFVNWTLDGTEVGTEPTYTFTVYGEATYVANFSLNLYEITAITNPVEGGTITGAGNYYHGDECTLTATPIENYTFLYWTENGNYLSSEAIYSFVATSDRSLVAVFAGNEQTMSLSPGWTWLSSYIEMDGIDGLSMLENGLNPNGVMIKSQRDGFLSYAADMWIGTLESISNEKMYLVNTNEPTDVTFTGPVANMMNHPITLNHNWTWMGYPSPFALDINDALANLNATEGDVVKSQSSFATYSVEDGWYGSLNTLTPGMGLMYQSHNSQPVTFNYGVGMSRALKANLTAENNHWVPDIHAYPNNMSIMAVVELNGVELQDERYELAVFNDSECRGSARLAYVPSLRRYVAFLTVTGEDDVELYLALYDTMTGKTYYNTTDCPNFETNAVLGSLSMPFVARFGSATELDELDVPNIELYPNPVVADHLFQMEMPAECQGARVSIVNALGAVISTTDVYDEPATLRAPAVPGVYTVRIVTEKQGTFTRKLIVNK